MKVKPLTIHWHQDSLPVYGACFQPRGFRLATAGGDKNVLMWRITSDSLEVEYLATLSYHEQAINCVAWSPDGEWLASAGDDGIVCLWHLSSSSTSERMIGQEDDKEVWRMVRKARTGGGEIYDLAWSPSGNFIAAATMDNVVRIFDASTAKIIHQLGDHGHYVQGVAWDPCGKYLASLSSDRSLLVYQLRETGSQLDLKRSPTRVVKYPISADRIAVYHNETFLSFFRRLGFSPDGALLITPAAQVKEMTLENGVAVGVTSNTSGILIYSRHDAFSNPIAFVPEPKQCLCIRFNPKLFTKRTSCSEPGQEHGSELLHLPYRMVYAVALQTSVLIYDTEQSAPLGHISNLHYSPLTDMTWSPDGKMLLISSIDGFCSVLNFDIDTDLGQLYDGKFAGPLGVEQSKEADATSATLGQSSTAPAANVEPVNASPVHTLVARKKQRVTPTTV